MIMATSQIDLVVLCI